MPNLFQGTVAPVCGHATAQLSPLVSISCPTSASIVCALTARFTWQGLDSKPDPLSIRTWQRHTSWGRQRLTRS
jgi:hypothetical protein